MVKFCQYFDVESLCSDIYRYPRVTEDLEVSGETEKTEYDQR